MFKFWYEKLLIRFSFLIAFIAFIGVFVYAYYTEITAYLPGEIAPFQETLVENNTNTLIPSARDLPLEKPHRTDKELKNWTSMAVSKSLSFDKNSFKEVSENIRDYFTQTGYRQYQDYLTSSGITDSVRKNDYTMNVYVEQQPILMNGKTVEGVYRWLYQLPVTISFIPKNTVNLIQDNDRIINRKINLRVQIRRVKKENDAGALAIESWKVTRQ